METLTFISASFAGVSCFAVLFRTPRKYFLHTLLIGAFACVGRFFVPASWHIGFSTFILSLCVGVISNAFARWTGMPAQGFLIPAVIFLVPGAYVYRAFSEALGKNIDTSVQLFLAAITITCGITFGLLIANCIVPTKKSL